MLEQNPFPVCSFPLPSWRRTLQPCAGEWGNGMFKYPAHLLTSPISSRATPMPPSTCAPTAMLPRSFPQSARRSQPSMPKLLSLPFSPCPVAFPSADFLLPRIVAILGGVFGVVALSLSSDCRVWLLHGWPANPGNRNPHDAGRAEERRALGIGLTVSRWPPLLLCALCSQA
jgi:hypothetical protein